MALYDIEVRALITNQGNSAEDETREEWVTFPIDSDERRELMERLGLDEDCDEVYIEYYDSDLPLDAEFGNDVSLDELNEFAERIEDLDYGDDKKLLALIEEHGGYHNLYDILDMMDDYELFEMSGEEYMQEVFEDTEYEFMRMLKGSWFESYVDFDWEYMFRHEADNASETTYGVLVER